MKLNLLLLKLSWHARYLTKQFCCANLDSS